MKYSAWFNIKSFWISAVLVGGLLFNAYFNGCSEVGFTENSKFIEQAIQSASLILINEDATYTKDAQVELLLQNSKANEVYVTNQAGCSSGGSWGLLKDKKSWSLGQWNKKTSVYAKFRNSDDNIESACVSDDIIHDNHLPEVNLYTPNFATRDSSVTFKFVTTDSLSGVKQTLCQWPGEAEVPCDMSSTKSNLIEGIALVNLRAEDNAGNESVPVVQRVTVDRSPPLVEITEGPASTTGSKNVLFKFTAVDSISGVETISCSIDGAQFLPCRSPLAANLNEGPHNLAVKATDLAGNESAPKFHNFTIDLTAPTVRITSSPADFVNSTSANFTYEGFDGANPITVFQCRVDSGTYANCSSQGHSVSGLSSGTHTFFVRGRDMVGNFSAEVARQWTIDLNGPTITILSGPKSLTNLLTAQFQFTVSDDRSGVDTITCSLDNGAPQNCATMVVNYNSLTSGSHKFQVTAKDKAGNQSVSAPYNWVVDNVAPNLQFTQTPGVFSKEIKDTFDFIATDAGGVEAVLCRIDTQAYAPCDGRTSHSYENLSEGDHRFAVQAKDSAGNLSSELVHMWKIDRTAPNVEYFQMPPMSVLSNRAVKLGFTVADAGSGLDRIECRLNDQVMACQSGQMVEWPMGFASSTGPHKFEVQAWDKSGNTVIDTKVWSILDATPQVQDINVALHNKVDVLVVVDNSPSMEEEQENMGTRFNAFLSKVAGLNWQVGIITTDVEEDKPLKDGRLVALEQTDNVPTSQYILKPSMDPVVAQKMFSNTVQMQAEGSGNELGIRATIRALSRSLDTSNAVNAPNNQLIRPDATLAILLISDAYDDETQPEELVNFMKANFPNKVYTFHSLVVPESKYTNPNGWWGNSNDPCEDYRESVRYDGRSYHALSTLTGGVKGTICSSNYTTQLSQMGQATAELLQSSTLICSPIDENRDGVVDKADVRIQLASGTTFFDFTLAGTKLTYTKPLPAGTHKVYFSCL